MKWQDITSAVSRNKSHFSVFIETDPMLQKKQSFAIYVSDTSPLILPSRAVSIFLGFEVLRQFHNFSSKIPPQDIDTVLCHIKSRDYVSIGSQTKSISRIFCNVSSGGLFF